MPRTHALLETTGRRSGLPRRVPVGNGLRGDTFWIVSEHGHGSDYVRNIEAEPARAREGRARVARRHGAVLPDDDVRARMRALGRPANDTMVRLVGSSLMTVRIDLDRIPPAPRGHDARMARRLIVDGMNVIGSRPTGWWRDRRGAMSELAEELARHAAETGDEVAVVLDSKPFDLPGATDGIDVRFAPARGPDAADDVIVDMVAADAEPSTLEVATSDKRLASRVRMLGAETISAGALRRALERTAVTDTSRPFHAAAIGSAHGRISRRWRRPERHRRIALRAGAKAGGGGAPRARGGVRGRHQDARAPRREVGVPAGEARGARALGAQRAK